MKKRYFVFFAGIGDIVITNSEHFLSLYLPANPTDKQIEILENLNRITISMIRNKATIVNTITNLNDVNIIYNDSYKLLIQDFLDDDKRSIK